MTMVGSKLLDCLLQIKIVTFIDRYLGLTSKTPDINAKIQIDQS